MDFVKLALLLDILHKAAAGGPAYQWLTDATEREIMKLRPTDPAAAKAYAAASHTVAKDENSERPRI